ncbi:MAG TPA: hypothetical protein VEY11_15995 [Pyrinomonadaceae bacterium]|nr:hypothetical protein [Pyrinomonadaceae bacterium]
MLKLPLALSACVLALTFSQCGNPPADNVNNNNGNSQHNEQVKAKSQEVERTLGEINSFAADVQRKVYTNPEVARGIDEAQALLDSKKQEMRAKVLAVKNTPAVEITPELEAKRGQLLYAAATGLGSLRITSPGKYDTPELKPKFDKLLQSYDETFKP